MKQEELEFILKSNRYLEGGTKEACIKVRDFLHHAKNPGNQLQSPMSCVTADEFAEAVKVLMEFAFEQEDTIPKKWKRENDCKINYYSCSEECILNKKPDKVCPLMGEENI